MTEFKDPREIDFSVDKDNLYREESITDLKVASIRRMVPVAADGSDDPTRSAIFVGSSQLMTPEGPLPLQARLQANSLSEAFDAFPAAMRQALDEVIVQLQQMRHQQANEQKQKDDSRIIVPGR